MENSNWTTANIPDLRGKTAIVTGANTGIGYEIALQLYKAGADVTIACRDMEKGKKAAANMILGGGRGLLRCNVLNLADLDSVHRFAHEFHAGHEVLHILINNAGVMYPPPEQTREGFELQFATNFLGHFALTAQLFDLLTKASSARIVTMSSGAYKRVDTIDFENLMLEKAYDASKAYATSKLADLIFALELDNRIKKKGLNVASMASHPGVTLTDLQRHIEPAERDKRMAMFGKMMPPAQAALPALFAATDPNAKSGCYYGPNGQNEYSGYPGLAFVTNAVTDPPVVNRLWSLAEKITGIVFP